MYKVIYYFSHITSLQRTLILAGGIAFFWMMESAVPLFHFDYNKWKHAGINIIFTISTLIINFFFAFLIVLSSDWCVKHGFGLVRWISMPLWAELIVGLLLLDLIGAYLIHYIQHKIKWMWSFHVIHHTDTHVDTTTANRHHPGESVFRAVFTIIAVFVTGAPVWLVLLYQTLSVLLSQFNHANIKMPPRLDAALRTIIVTPNMHRIHHHYQRPETDSNYGNIFAFWDRIFGTYVYRPAEKLQYGIDVLSGRNDESIGDQMMMPFDKKVKTDF